MMHIVEENIPMIYRFSWEQKKNDCAIVLEIKKCQLKIISERSLKMMAPYLIEEFGFEKFESSLSAKKFGFENALTVENNDQSEFLRLVFQIQHIKDRETEQYFFAAMASFKLLLDSMNLSDYENITANDKYIPQFIMIETVCCKRRIFGGHISGEFNVDARNFFGSYYVNKGQNIKPALAAIKKAVKKINGKKTNKMFGELYSVEVRTDDGFLVIDCPGNACGLNPADWPPRVFSKNPTGYEFSSHNVDDLYQQFVILVGLSVLSALVEKAYIKNI